MIKNYVIIDETIKDPVVSVAMLAYNHSKYIVEAIESVLMQKTDFPIQLVIAEDCSPDNTREIILDYQRKYPHIIKLVLQNENVGAMVNNGCLLKELDGKYIAALEGDDYWIDENKLEKQVSILEEKENISICMTYVKYFFEGSDRLLDFPVLIDNKKDAIYTLKEYLRFRFSHTSSFVFRRSLYDNNQLQGFFGSDQAIVINLALKGDIYYLSDLTSLYRINKGSISSTTKKNKWITSTIEFYKSVDVITNYKHSKLIRYHILYHKILKILPIVFLERVLSKVYFISLRFFK